jgi:hypothetical protein
VIPHTERTIDELTDLINKREVAQVPTMRGWRERLGIIRQALRPIRRVWKNRYGQRCGFRSSGTA